VSSATSSERRRKELLNKLPKGAEILASWPTVSETLIAPEDLDRYRSLCTAAKYFTLKQSTNDIAAAAEMRAFRALDYIEKAMEPWHEGTGIIGTRAFVRHLVQRKRTRTADMQKVDAEDAPMSGFGGLFKKLLADHPAIETELTKFLNGHKRPNKVTPKVLLTKFVEICGGEKLTDTDYPLCCESKGSRPLMRWFKNVYLPKHLLAHILRNNGKAAADAAGHELGDGETRTPACDYLCWVIDECDSNINTKTEIPSARWDREVI
jgi:hypothetical protein